LANGQIKNYSDYLSNRQTEQLSNFKLNWVVSFEDYQKSLEEYKTLGGKESDFIR
jgi:hypothetical protein